MKHSKILQILIYMTSITLLIALAYGLIISNEIKNKTEEMSFTSRSDFKYHLMLLLKDSDEMYSNEFIDAIGTEAERMNIATEFIFIDEEDYLEAVLDRLDMAIYSKVDGIILHAYDHTKIIDKINQATEIGIPVVTLNENVHMSKRIAHVGSSKYSIGLTVGKTIAQIINGLGKVAIIDQFSYGENDMDLLSLGIADVFIEYEGLNLVSTRYTEEGVLSAERVASELLIDYPDLDAIYCTNGQSTLGIVQVLIDRNKVNQIDLIGTGDEDEILDYINNNQVIDASIITDYSVVAIEAITAFYEYMETGIVNTQIIPPVLVVTNDNIDNFIEEGVDEN